MQLSSKRAGRAASLVALVMAFASLSAPAFAAVASTVSTLEVAHAGPSFATPGAANVPVMAFTLANSSSKNKLRMVRARWNGSASTPNADLTAVKVFRESGALAGAKFSASTDTLLVSVVPTTATEVKLDVPDFAFTQTRLYIVADVAASAVGGRAIDFKIEQEKISFRNGNWPSAAEESLWNPAGSVAINRAPTGQNASTSTDEDVAKALTLTGLDADGHTTSFAITRQPTYGVLSPIGTPACDGNPTRLCEASVTYTPLTDYVGRDSFSYRATDQLGLGSSEATISITVGPGTNDFPVANADSASTDEDTALTIDVLANDTDADADALSVSGVDTPTEEGATITCATSCVYRPAPNFYGIDTFAYTASDGKGGSSNALVTVTVSSVNDRPVAVDDTYDLVEDSSLVVDGLSALDDLLGNDADADGHTLTAELVDDADHGALTLSSNGSFSYTPNPDHHGTDSFTYRVSDGLLASSPATVTLNVSGVNDAPVCSTVAIMTDEDVVAAAAPACSDVDADALTIQVASAPSHGDASLRDGMLRYSPAANFNGEDSFTYRATDGSLFAEPGTVNVSVAPIRDGARAIGDQIVVAYGSAATPVPVLANDIASPEDAAPISVSGLTQPAHGSASIIDGGQRIAYEPAAGWTGPDSFTYTISDGIATDTAMVTTEVAPAARLTTPSTITGVSRVTFSEPVAGLDPASVTLRVTGTTSNLSATLRCYDGASSSVDCSAGPVSGATLSRTLIPGQRYTLTAGGSIADLGGNGLRPGSVGSSFRASRVEQEASIAVTPRWRGVSSASAYGGSYTMHRRKGASATYAFSGPSVTWYTVKGPRHGKAAVYIDGTLRQTVDTYASTTLHKRGYTYDGLGAGTHSIRIVALGTKRSAARSTFVALDAFKSGGVVASTPAARYAWPRSSSKLASGGALASSDLAGTTTSFTFRGTGIRWDRIVGPNRGKAAVSIDGKRIAVLDNYAPTAKASARSFGSLSDGVHTVKITVLGTKRAASTGTWVSLDRWVVS